ncbi:hypothetical protein B1992_15190 [Pseudoxanthomonas broegbernensis]|uniref:Helicase HerA central domain-containing protein n=2 Tax=Pseudoxanthomonas broegbernensis TaxID=83619 RepID=A0A7V8GJS3_9GAMM|nr:hypothetical protein B1992_15190 [Pseudoxanthomonas broegbernensis]
MGYGLPSVVVAAVGWRTPLPDWLRLVLILFLTGSGKTSCVSSLLQGFVSGGWSSSNIIVVDPHGEYSRALGDSARV